MPPRGSEGLDFTPILTHYCFLLTTILAVLGWFIAFISQCIATNDLGERAVAFLWFAIFLQLFLIMGVVYTLASDSIAMHRFQISVFGAVSLVFAVLGADAGLFSGAASMKALGAGWLILAMVDIIWVLYFTSEDGSLTLHIFNSFGTGGLTPPSRRRTRPPSNMNMGMTSTNNGYATGYAGGGIGSADMAPYGSGKMGSTTGTGMARSQGSFGANSVDERSRTGAGSIRNEPGPGSAAGGDVGNPNSPLMMGVGAVGGGGGQLPPQEPTPGGDNYAYKAKALYAYTASPDDPNEISFTKGEILDILDKSGKWWQGKKADGAVGIAPSNYLQII